MQGRLAAAFVVELMDYAAGVAVFLRADEIIGIQHQLVEALVPVQLRQVQQRQLRLRRQQQAAEVVEIDAGECGQVLVGEKQHGPLAQAAVLVGVQAVEDRQVPAYPLPELFGHRVACQQAPAPPGAERPHAQSLWALACLAALACRRWRMKPRIIGSSDSRMMPITSSDRFFLMNGTLPKK